AYVSFMYTFPKVAVPSALIESVTITGVDAPVAGATPDCDVTVSATGCYKRDYSNEWIKDGVAWYDLTASKAIKTTDTFIAGHAYRVDVYMISEDGYTFYNADGSAATAGTINGNAAETDRYNATLLLFMYTFPALPEAAAPAALIESVTITDVDAPVVGATPDFDVTVSGTGCQKEDYNVDTSSDYWKDGVKWADKTTHTFLRPTDTFLAGHEYSVVVSMVSESGYTFYNADGSVATAGTIDGNAAETDKWNPSTLYLYVFFPKLPEAETPATLIESVAITGVTAPVAGQTPSYDVTVNTAGCHRQDYTNDWWKDGVSWRDMTTGETLAATETFIAGHEYRVYVHLTCEDGFIFFDTTNGVITTATINGKDVSFYQYTHPSIGFYYTFPAVAEPEPEHLFPVDFYGFAEYEGGLFYVYQGDVVTDANGLVNDPNNPADWYFCANGQAQLQYSGLAEYGGEWFYLENGKLNTARVGIVEYDGGRFMIAAGRILREVNGLIQDPNTGLWYYVAAGQVADYTGLVQYDGAWFYVTNGELATGYTGPVEYNGATFQVVNGQMVA
ncbi:MAG: hypothetical protein IK080_03075, partial [Clostridia bacterium]|nr:hypothetical protein [Clostridia bacterium]